MYLNVKLWLFQVQLLSYQNSAWCLLLPVQGCGWWAKVPVYYNSSWGCLDRTKDPPHSSGQGIKIKTVARAKKTACENVSDMYRSSVPKCIFLSSKRLLLIHVISIFIYFYLGIYLEICLVNVYFLFPYLFIFIWVFICIFNCFSAMLYNVFFHVQ